MILKKLEGKLLLNKTDNADSNLFLILHMSSTYAVCIGLDKMMIVLHFQERKKEKLIECWKE